MIKARLGDRYLLQEPIGQGGMGTVWRGFDTVLERPVAVKVLNPAGLATEGRARLLAEARAIARLDHPNIVSVYDAGESDGSPYIVMELVEGRNLHDHPPADFGEIIAIAHQICAALEHAHENGIVHRDLKPENVVIGKDRLVRLMDFGIAQSVSSRITREGTILGTVFYMAPEQALGQTVDARADLYSLGVMLYELTTGALPFTHDDPGMVITQHVHAAPVPPRAKREDFPPALSKLILALMSKDPKERPTSAAEVGKMLASSTLLSLEAAPEDEPTALERIARGRIVGRDGEIERARGLWMKARSGYAQTLLIRGAPGVGKSRLLRELRTHAELSGGWTLGAACFQEGGAPYAGFRQVLREAFRKGDGAASSLPAAALPDLIALLPELATDFPYVSPHPLLDPHADQARLLESLAMIVSELARQRPLLLYLDDAHWADSGTLSLLRHLIRSTQGRPLMVVLTHREQELDQALPFHEALLDLERTGRAATIDLKPLPREQTRELLAAIFQEEITEEFLDGIHLETEGNPFFIEEVCKALVESGKLYYRKGRWHRPSIEKLGIPKSVRVAIQARVSKLPTESQKVLKQAAVLGRAFDLPTLQLATQTDQERLLDALEDAEEAQLVEVDEKGRGELFQFAHALIPSTLVEGLRIVERRRLHRQAATALKQSRPGAFARLARHYREAGHLDQGIDYLLQAGNEARMLHSHQEAIDCYRQASDHYLEVGDYRRVSSVLFRLALTYHNAFEFEKSREAYDRAFSMLQRSASVQVAGSVLAPHPFRFASHEPLTLDPTRVHESFSWVFIHQLFRGLVEERPDTGVVPDIASSWEVKEGGTKYVFHLRPDARWTDGEPITSNDFGYAWRRVLEPGGGSPLAALLYDIKGAKDYHQVGPTYADTLGIITPDPHTLVVELESPANYFLSILAQPTAYPVPQRTIEAYGESWTTPGRIVTNGPFRLDRWVNGRLMTMDRDRSVPGGSIGNVDRLEILLYSGDGSHLLGEYEKDQLDMLLLDRMPIEVHEVARQRHASEYISTPLLETTFIFFDVHRAPFDDRRVRQAFARAVDRERIANLDMHGLVSPATGSFVPPGIPGHFTGASGSYDPDVARRLLAKAGFAGGKGFPTLQVPVAFEFFQGTALKALCQRWEETLGVEITPKELPFEAYMERLRVDPPMVGIAGWLADYPDPYNFLNFQGGVFWWTSNPWRDERYDQLVQTGRLTMDLTARLEYYRQAEAILAVEVPLLPINYHRMSLLLKPWISAFPISMTGNTYFIKDAVIEQH